MAGMDGLSKAWHILKSCSARWKLIKVLGQATIACGLTRAYPYFWVGDVAKTNLRQQALILLVAQNIQDIITDVDIAYCDFSEKQTCSPPPDVQQTGAPS